MFSAIEYLILRPCAGSCDSSPTMHELGAAPSIGTAEVLKHSRKFVTATQDNEKYQTRRGV